MTFSQFENGMRAAQFECCEDVCMEPFSTRCKVQTMRDGNVYITELPRRVRNKALYRRTTARLRWGMTADTILYSRSRSIWPMSCRNAWCARPAP